MPPKRKKGRSVSRMTPLSTETESSLEPGSNFPPDAYAVDTNVLCKHVQCFYEAKIVKVRMVKGVVKYTVHYKGWNARYDEVLTHAETFARFREHTEENVIIANREIDELKLAKKNDKKRAASRPAADQLGRSVSKPPSEPAFELSSTEVHTGLELTEDSEPMEVDLSSTSEEESSEGSPPAMFLATDQIVIPEGLDKVLLDDCDMVTRQYKVPLLPARITVKEIMKRYVAQSELFDGLDENQKPHKDLMNLLNDLMHSFNKILHLRVLYKFEFVQHLKILNEKRALKGLPEIPHKDYMQLLYADKDDRDHSDSNEDEYTPSTSTKRPAKKKTKTKVPVDVQAPEFDFTDSYGFIHIVRFFYQYNLLITTKVIKDVVGEEVFQIINDIVYFLSTHVKAFFDVNTDYVVAGPAYQRQVFG